MQSLNPQVQEEQEGRKIQGNKEGAKNEGGNAESGNTGTATCHNSVETYVSSLMVIVPVMQERDHTRTIPSIVPYAIAVTYSSVLRVHAASQG